MSIRTLAERMSRGIVLSRRLPAKFGSLPIYVTPEAGLRYWLVMSKIDPLLYKMAEELVTPQSVVWDVGANVGLFSFCAAALSGRDGFVLSIEPDLWLAQLIVRSSRRWDSVRYACSNVKVLCASISDSNGVSELAVAQRARASNHLVGVPGSAQAGSPRHLQLSASLTLDSLLEYFPAPSVLKIDVEAYEVKVLRGAKKLLEEIRPRIWCEVSHQNSQDVAELLHGAKYELYGAETRPHQRIDRAWFQTLAIPLTCDSN
jgi:FkbM family methyltransferase